MSDLVPSNLGTNGQPVRVGVARRAWKARKSDEINLEVGERITDIEKTTSDQWLSGRNSQGISGYFPVRYVNMVATTAEGELHVAGASDALEVGHSRQQHMYLSSHLPPSKIEYHHTQNNTYVNVNGDLKNDYTTNIDASRKAALHKNNTTSSTTNDNSIETVTGNTSTINHTTTTTSSNTYFESKQRGGPMSWATGSIVWILLRLGFQAPMAQSLATLIVIAILALVLYLVLFPCFEWIIWIVCSPFSYVMSWFSSGGNATNLSTDASWWERHKPSWLGGNDDFPGGATSNLNQERGHYDRDDDSKFSDNNMWIINTNNDPSHISDFSLLSDALSEAKQRAIELERNTEVAQLSNGEISSNLELAGQSVDETREDHNKFVEDIALVVQKDRSSSQQLENALRKGDALAVAKQRRDAQVFEPSAFCAYVPSILGAWVCEQPPEPVTARSILANRLKIWRQTLNEAKQSRKDLLKNLRDPSQGSISNTCTANRGIQQLLEHYRAVMSRQTIAGTSAGSEMISTGEDKDLQILGGQSELLCRWTYQIADWSAEKTGFFEREIRWFESALQKLNNVWVDDDSDDDDDGGGGSKKSDVDEMETRRAEKLMSDQISELTLMLKGHWEHMY